MGNLLLFSISVHPRTNGFTCICYVVAFIFPPPQSTYRCGELIERIRERPRTMKSKGEVGYRTREVPYDTDPKTTL